MSRPAVHSVATWVAGSAGPGHDPAPTEGELLTRFVRERDEAAFAELARRLGPMVLGICRRHLRDDHLAEDAFQAVFVVLARRANDVRPREGVKAWTHGVAVRTARRASMVSARRRAKEVVAAPVPDRAVESPEPPDADALRTLDEEVAALPDHLRVAVVLCEFDGLSRKAAAARLKVPEGTVSSRLAKARKLLATRLRHRGITLSAAALTAAFARPASALPSVGLVSRAVRAATHEPGPAAVAELSQGVLRMLFLNKLKTTFAVAAAVGLLACAAAAVSDPGPSAPSVKVQPPPVPLVRQTVSQPARGEAKPLPKGPNRLLLWRAGQLELMDPDGKGLTKVSEGRTGIQPGTFRLSPDGKQVAVLVVAPKLKPGEPVPPNLQLKLFVRGLNEKEAGTDLDTTCQTVCWSPDGTHLAVADFQDRPSKGKPTIAHYLINVKAKEKEKLMLPDDHILTDWSRDGKYFVTTSVAGEGDKRKTGLHLVNRDGSEYKALTDESERAKLGRISPDGTRVLYASEPAKEAPTGVVRGLKVLEIAAGKKTTVGDIPLNADIQGYCWSPDGKRIAYVWREILESKPGEAEPKETETTLVTCDPDGKNQKTVTSEKGQGRFAITLGEVDWR